MNTKELYEAIEAEEVLQGMGVNPEEQYVVIRCIPNDLVTRVHLDNIKDADWETLRAILVGDREPQALKHMTRVVGYYSNTENWNKSKIGELKDRQKGSYAFAE